MSEKLHIIIMKPTEEELKEENVISNKNNHENNGKEYERFMKHSPLITLLLMSIGPISTLVMALGSMMDTIQISKRYSKEVNSYALEMIGFSTNIFTIISYVGSFIGQGLVTRVPSLIGSGKREEACNLSIDIFRIGVCFSILFAIGFNFAIKPFLNFVGCPDYMLDSTYKMFLPMLIGLPISSLYTIAYSFMQSIGSSIYSALFMCGYGIFKTCVSYPIFLFAIRISEVYIKLPVILSQFIFVIIGYFLIFRGYFSLKPDIKLLCGRFCKETITALLLSCPLIIYFISYELPPILILQSLTNVASEYSEIIGSFFAVFTNISSLQSAIISIVAVSYLACGTHAFGSSNIKRLLSYIRWVLLFDVLLPLIITPIAAFKPRLIASLFISDDLVLDFTEKLLPIPFYTNWLNSLMFFLTLTHIITGTPLLAFIPNFVQVCILCIGCPIIAKKLQQNEINKIMYMYNISDISGLIVHLFIIFFPIRIILRKLKQTRQVPSEQNEIDLSLISNEQNL